VSWLRQARWIAAFAALLIASALTIGEVSALVSGVPINGISHSANVMWSVTNIFGKHDAFVAWALAVHSGVTVDQWLAWTIWLDIGIIVGYAGLFAGLSVRWGLGLRWFIVGLVAADVAEDVASLVAIGALRDGAVYRSAAPTVLSWLSLVKWLAFGAVIVAGVYRFVTNPANRARFVAGRRIVRLHRIQLIPLAVLAVLLVVQGNDILQQGVDIERAWFLTDTGIVRGTVFALTALAAIGALGVVLRFLSSVHVSGLHVPAPAPPLPAPAPATPTSFWGKLVRFQRSLPWATAAVLVVAAAAFLSVTSLARIYWLPLIGVAGVLAAVQILVSLLHGLPDNRPPLPDESPLRPLAWKVGRLLAWSVVALLLISIARAYTDAMLLGDQTLLAMCVVAIGSALACVVAFWACVKITPKFFGDDDFTVHRFARYIHPQLVGVASTDTRTAALKGGSGDTVGPVSTIGSIGPLAAATVVAAAALLLFPGYIARGCGAVGVIGLCLGALALFFATISVAAQAAEPPPLFQAMRLQRTPVIAIVVVVGVLSTILGRSDALHQVRNPPNGSVAENRVELRAAFAAWSRTTSCTFDATANGEAVSVRPLLFVAAEGGGIRAAWWTVKAMDALTGEHCQNSVLLSSGVSGGAVGLGVLATSAEPEADLKSIAGPDAVAAALEGMLSRDVVSGVFGVNGRAVGTGSDHYPDRAALMEEQWDDESSLGTTFPVVPRPQSPWYTVFNGTSVLHHCRVLVANVRLGEPKSSDCANPTAAVPGTYDLFDDQSCLLGIRTSTASMLAARFPYVTPSGVIRNCTGTRETVDQVIDGGYSENSGIDTLDAAMTELMPDIRAANATAVTEGGRPMIVPIVVYLHNKPVASVGKVASSGTPSAEVFIPPGNLGSGSAVFSKPPTLLARSEAIARDWLEVSSIADAASQARARAVRVAVDKVLPNKTITVAPLKVAQIGVPLGWQLSRASRTTLDDALAAYVTCSQAKVPCQQGAEFGLLNKMAPP
jgi:hypothetical protein